MLATTAARLRRVKPEPEGVPREASFKTAYLAAHAKAGQREAFDGLYQRVAPSLYAWAHHRMHGTARTACDPEDVIQEVWHRAYVSLDKYDPAVGTFRAWIFGLAKHVLLDVVRHAARLARAGRPGSRSSAFHWSQVDDGVTALSQRVARDDTVRQFLALVAELPQEDQELLVRCGLEGATCEEVGLRLGLGREAALKRWQRLRERVSQNPRYAKLMEG